MGSMGRKKKGKVSSQERILECAATVIAERGPMAIVITEIAKQCEVTHGYIHACYPDSTRHMSRKICEIPVEKVRDLIVGLMAIQQSHSPFERLITIFRVILDVFCSDRTLGAAAAIVYQSDRDGRAGFRQWNHIFELTERTVKEVRDAGELAEWTASLSEQEIRQSLFSMLFGLIQEPVFDEKKIVQVLLRYLYVFLKDQNHAKIEEQINWILQKLEERDKREN